MSWWHMILNDAELQNDPLDPLPKPWKRTSLESQSPSLLSQPPAASSYFDMVYHNLAALYNLHTTAAQTILAPNTQLIL